MIRSFAIIPAAGSSARMGRPKLLLPWGESTVIEQVLVAWRQGGIDRLTVVVHPHDDQLAEICRSRGARVVVPDTPPPDMKASIQFGLDAVAAEDRPALQDVWLTAPADMPELDSNVIAQLLREAAQLPGTILVPSHEARRGHPVLFPWPLAAEVATLPPNRGIDHLLAQFPLRTIECGPAALASDIDTPTDYERRHNLHNRSEA